MAVKCNPHKHSSGKGIAKGATRLWKGATRLRKGRPDCIGGDHGAKGATRQQSRRDSAIAQVPRRSLRSPRVSSWNPAIAQQSRRDCCDRPSLLELISCDHEQSRGPYVTSRDQLCLSATRRGPEGTTRVKVLSHNLTGSIRAYKYNEC